MIQRVSEDAIIFWQIIEEGVGEAAILIKRYTDCLELQQEKRTILISLEIVEEFLKAAREATKEKKGQR